MSLPSETSEPVPNLPTVNAIAPNAPIGAAHITMATMRKNIREAISIRSVSGLPAAPERAQCEAAQHRDVEHLEHIAFAERADEGIWDDREQKLRRGAVLRLFDISRDARRIDVR